MASSLRLEIRGLVCKRASTNQKLIGMAYASNLAFLLLGTLVTLLAVPVMRLPAWVYLLPVGVLLSSVTQYLIPAQNSAEGALRKIGWMTQVISGVSSLAQVMAALVLPSAFALSFSRILGWAVGAIFMQAPAARGLRDAKALNQRDIRRLLRSSRHEISYGVVASAISVVTLQIPVYIFTLYAKQPQVGLYWLAFNLLFVPYHIVSGSIRPIYLRATASQRNTLLAYKGLLRKLTVIALFVGLAVSIVLSSACQLIVSIFLSEQWKEAGLFAFALIPLLSALSAQTPISYSISVFGLQKFNLIGGVVQVVVRTAAMIAAMQFTQDAFVALLAFSVASAVVYAGYIFFGLYLVRSKLPAFGGRQHLPA
jgi:O-antigen/teichoic acid export membrane protein